jgi:predicted PurR-regulated permease PerM
MPSNPEPGWWPQMFDRRTIRILFTTLTFALVITIIYIARTILIIFVFSILFAYLIDPAVTFLQRYSLFFKDLRGPHIFQAYLGFLILFALLVHAFAPDSHGRPGSLAGEIPVLADKVASGEIASSFGKNLGLSDSQTERLRAFLQGHRSDIESTKASIQRSAFTIAGGVLVIPILAIFFLSDGEKLANQVIVLASATSEVDAVRSLVADLNVMLQRYIRAKVTLGTLSFLFCSAALLVLRFPHWLALGVVAGMLEFIPIAGWMIAATTIATFGALTHSHWIWMLGLLGVWRVCMDYGISPRVMGHQLEIHPLLAIFTVMVGGAVGGIAGIYISIALVATLRVIWRRLAAPRYGEVS